MPSAASPPVFAQRHLLGIEHLSREEIVALLDRTGEAARRRYPAFRDFTVKAMTFLAKDVPGNWRMLCDKITDNFRVINPSHFRVLR